MEKKFYSDNFEDLLRENADQFKMYPSKKVWQGIYNNVRPGTRWPSLAMSILFIFSLVIIGHLNTQQSEHTYLTSIKANSGQYSYNKSDLSFKTKAGNATLKNSKFVNIAKSIHKNKLANQKAINANNNNVILNIRSNNVQDKSRVKSYIFQDNNVVVPANKNSKYNGGIFTDVNPSPGAKEFSQDNEIISLNKDKVYHYVIENLKTTMQLLTINTINSLPASTNLNLQGNEQPGLTPETYVTSLNNAKSNIEGGNGVANVTVF